MTNGERVVATASKYIGVYESWGSNQGPYINGWEARWGMKGEPWCGMFADAMFYEADVSDNGLCHPSTGEMCSRAAWQGAFIDNDEVAPPGSLWIKCGIHTAIVVRDNKDGTVTTIGGNETNGVRLGRKSKADGRIIVPPAIKADATPPPPKYEYWFEDENAKQFLFNIKGKVAAWASKAARDKRMAELKQSDKWKKYHPRPIVRKDSKGRTRYYIVLGPYRYYGPYDSKEARDKAKGLVEKRLGRTLRSFRRKVK